MKIKGTKVKEYNVMSVKGLVTSRLNVLLYGRNERRE